MDGRARRAGPLRSCLAAWIAVFLAIVPLARPLPGVIALSPATSLAAFSARHHGAAQAELPAPRVRPAHPLDLGVLARGSWIEAKLGLSPTKSPVVRPSVAVPPLALPRVTAAPGAGPGVVFHRSAVGTARNPTGPPA
jgi:hypothetical protein